MNNQKYHAFRLTDKGEKLAQHVEHCIDLRLDRFEKFTCEERAGLAVVAHFRMLERSGFDISPVEKRIAEAEAAASHALELLRTDGKNILFSPFQSLPPNEIAEIFPSLSNSTESNESISSKNVVEKLSERKNRSHLFVRPKLVNAEGHDASIPATLNKELEETLHIYEDIDTAVRVFTENHGEDTKDDFYPLVTCLFQILGFKCDHSRTGVPYQRWDARVWVDGYGIPVEIKSPAEEYTLSTKAVRQAIENKVILMSREILKTHREMSSLIIGNQLPNERGEMSDLIDDIFRAFDIRIGVIDLPTLTRLALRAMRDNVTIDAKELSQLKGFLCV